MSSPPPCCSEVLPVLHTPGAEVECPTCRTRYRLRSREVHHKHGGTLRVVSLVVEVVPPLTLTVPRDGSQEPA
jgi:hypothetical protein